MKKLLRHFSMFLTFSLTLSTLFPARLALALKDCGKHEIVSCETHDNQHFVAKHALNSAEGGDATSDNSVRGVTPSQDEHDAAHQIGESSPVFLSPTSKVSNEVNLNDQPPFIPVADRSFSLVRMSVWANGPPVLSNSFHTSLPSIRLQI